ncbi:Hypothetical predicted protein, partial [Marmota monax]
VHVLAVVHAVASQLRRGRRGCEFGRPGCRAAVIVLLPAHARGRHLPDRPRPGRLCPRPQGGPPGGPRSNNVWEARAETVSSRPDPWRLPASGEEALLSETPWSHHSRDGAVPPAGGRRLHGAGRTLRGPAATARDQARSRLSPRPEGASWAAWILGPRLQAAPGARRDGRRRGCGGRWRRGGLPRGKVGTWRRTRESWSSRYQGARLRPAERAVLATSFPRSQAPPRAAASPASPHSRTPAAGTGAQPGVLDPVRPCSGC